MSIFKNIFGNPNEESRSSKIDWTPLTDIEQLNEIEIASNEKSIVIFKHSTRCSISRMALKQFENEYNLADKVTPYFLDLLNYREVSNAIASRFEVQHQSPQLLLIKGGISVYNASHSDIDAETLKHKL